MPTAPNPIPSNEIAPKPKRRSFTPAYKADIVAKANACTKPGEVGELLRREGLYSSHLTEWRKAAKAGTIKALGRKRGPKKQRTAAELRAEKAEREYLLAAPRPALSDGLSEARGDVSRSARRAPKSNQRDAGEHRWAPSLHRAAQA